VRLEHTIDLKQLSCHTKLAESGFSRFASCLPPIPFAVRTASKTTTSSWESTPSTKRRMVRKMGRQVPVPTRPFLWDALDLVRKKDLFVTMKRVGKVLGVDARNEIPASGDSD